MAPRRALSRQAIVSAALEILRAEGMDAVSMRRVATALGTGPASLYAHVANKDELLDLLYDELLSVDDVLERVDAVTPEAVQRIARELLVRPMSLAVIGPFDDHDFASVLG